MSLPRGLTPLRHRGFSLLAGGQLASNVGDAFYAVALPWYVLADHGGALLLATVLAAYGIPRTALVAVGGHASDRWRPWTVMMASDSVRAVGVAVLAAVAFSGPAKAVVLVPVAAVIGAGEGLFLPGSFSIIPSLLPDEDLQAGNALSASGTQLAGLVGPAIGGIVIAVVGPATAFVVDAASFAVSAATLAGIRAYQLHAGQEPAPVDAGTSAESEQAEAPPGGLEEDPRIPAKVPARPLRLRQVLRSERVLQLIVLVTLAANLGSGGLGEVALPSLAHGPLHAGAAGYGGLIASIGAGALVGTLAAGQIRRLGRPAVVASVAFLAEGVFMAVTPYLHSPYLAGISLALFGGLNGFGLVVAITALQRWAAPELLGRVMGVILLASFGIFPVSVVLAGAIVHSFGPDPFFPAAGGVLVLSIIVALSQRRWREFGMPASSVGATGARREVVAP